MTLTINRCRELTEDELLVVSGAGYTTVTYDSDGKYTEYWGDDGSFLGSTMEWADSSDFEAPTFYFGASGAFVLGWGFEFGWDMETGDVDLSVGFNAGVGVYGEIGFASDIPTANETMEATDDAWWIVGKLGGSAGGDLGDGNWSAGVQAGAGGMLTDNPDTP